VRLKRGFLMMPFLGMHSYQQAAASNTDPGLRFGTFLGGRLSDLVSMNAELRLDVTNPGDLPAGTDVTEVAFAATFSPLIQVPVHVVEIVIGPKLGGIIVKQTLGDATGKVHNDGLGFVAGGNVGVFVPVAPPTSLGVLLSLEVVKLAAICNEVCVSNGDVPASVVLGLTAAALF
jgi:hypothetical protein